MSAFRHAFRRTAGSRKPIFVLSLLGLILSVLSPIQGNTNEASASIIEAAVHDPDRWQRDQKRDQRSRPLEILGFSKVERGMTVLDLFTGGGYWAELFARAVGPEGKVLAHTNAAYRNFAGPLLESRFANGRVATVTVHDAELNDLGLEAQQFDLIFIGLGYHDLYFYADFWPLPGRDRFFAQLHRALRPNGTIVIIDHAAQPGSGARAAQGLHRIDEAFARSDFESAGFEFLGASDALRNPDDDHTANVFADAVRHRTDRFVYRFRKSAAP